MCHIDELDASENKIDSNEEVLLAYFKAFQDEVMNIFIMIVLQLLNGYLPSCRTIKPLNELQCHIKML